MPISLSDRIDRQVSGTSGVGFNGQLLESWGCYLPGNGYRAYSPALARFYSPDRWSPFDRGGLNAYAYCSGDPVNRVDPSGRWEEQVLPLLTIILNVGLFNVAVMGLQSTSPAMQKRPALLATYLSASGALFGLYGAYEQLIGHPEGRYISAVGTVLAATSAWGRFGIAWKADRAERKKLRDARRQQNAIVEPAETQYIAPASRPTSPVSTRAALSPPSPSAASSAARGSPMLSRSNTTSPVASLPNHMRETRSPSVLSSISRTSANSQQSTVGDLPALAKGIRMLERGLSVRSAMVALS